MEKVVIDVLNLSNMLILVGFISSNKFSISYKVGGLIHLLQLGVSG